MMTELVNSLGPWLQLLLGACLAVIVVCMTVGLVSMTYRWVRDDFR